MYPVIRSLIFLSSEDHGVETRGFNCRNKHNIVPLIKILVDESVEKHEVVLRDDDSEQKSFYPRPVDTITLSMRMPSLSAEKVRGGRYGWAL